MAKYIDAEYIPKDKFFEDMTYKEKAKVVQWLIQAPTADVASREVFEQVKWERDTALQTLQEHGIGLGQKVEHGEWIVVDDGVLIGDGKHLECSKCGVWKKDRQKSNYCPNCGAKMDLKEGAEE